MIIVYSLLAAVVGYLLFLSICALAVNPDKDYRRHSHFYRSLLNGAAAIALWVCRVKIHTTGAEKLPPIMRTSVIARPTFSIGTSSRKA